MSLDIKKFTAKHQVLKIAVFFILILTLFFYKPLFFNLSIVPAETLYHIDNLYRHTLTDVSQLQGNGLLRRRSHCGQAAGKSYQNGRAAGFAGQPCNGKQLQLPDRHPHWGWRICVRRRNCLDGLNYGQARPAGSPPSLSSPKRFVGKPHPAEQRGNLW